MWHQRITRLRRRGCALGGGSPLCLRAGAPCPPLICRLGGLVCCAGEAAPHGCRWLATWLAARDTRNSAVEEAPGDMLRTADAVFSIGCCGRVMRY